MKKAEIITIGDEILIGQIIDTNSAFIAKQLNKIGIDIFQITSVQDDREHILAALSAASENVDVVITTGGLGPTKDDITKKTLCEYFNDELVTDQKVLKHIEEIFEKHIKTPILASNRAQAKIPSKSTGLFNRFGTAPGMWIEHQDVVYISLPGVPYEMKALFRDHVIPRLQNRYQTPFIIHKTLLTYGLGESAIADKIAHWEDDLPNSIKLAYLPGLGRVRLRLSARGNNENDLKNQLEEEIQKLHLIIGDIIKGYEDELSIEERIAKLLTANKFTIATAESCTGGRIAAKFSEIPGASAYLKGGVVSYATSAKTDVLNIPTDFIAKHSVVSEEITNEMAQRVKKMFKVDYAIATTGNAGPTKGDSEAEIGTVFISLATPNQMRSFCFNFGKERESVTQRAVNKSMEIILEELINATEKKNEN
ncbi:MAG: competence/damage-inducible protein A [Bacteroidota bacterium]